MTAVGAPQRDPESFAHLSNSRPIVWDRRANGAAAEELVTRLFAELTAKEVRLRARRVDDANRLRTVLEVFALDLALVAEECPDRFITYPLRREEYGTDRKRYVLEAATGTTVSTVAGFLQDAGYATGKRGSYRRTDWGGGVTTGGGYRSRLRATPKFVALLGELGMTPDQVRSRGEFELIRLKSPSDRGRKELQGYEDNDQTRAWRSDLQKWALVAAAHRIVNPNGPAVSREAMRDDGDGAGEVVELRKAQLYRVFNDGRFDRGGRFYGGWWITLSKADRAAITIDGQPVVELDFKAFYPRLCYDLEQVGLDGNVDPYDVPVLRSRVTRDALKVALNQLVAVGPGARPRKPQGTRLPSRLSYKAVLAALEQQHSAIRHWLREARALELQWIDSEIAGRVLAFMTTTMKRPVLPVHDSFIVARADEAALGEAMARSYRAVVEEMVGKGAWPVVDGWSSPAIRDQVARRLGV